MKKALEYWAPDPKERRDEIKARREKLERQHLAPVRARVALLNLRAEQRAIFDRLLEDVASSPRDDGSLRDPLTRLHSYLRRRESDPRCAKPIPQKARDKIVRALEENNLPVTEDAILAMWAKAKK